jgi:hypothetical protein
MRVGACRRSGLSEVAEGGSGIGQEGRSPNGFEDEVSSQEMTNLCRCGGLRSRRIQVNSGYDEWPPADQPHNTECRRTRRGVSRELNTCFQSDRPPCGLGKCHFEQRFGLKA